MVLKKRQAYNLATSVALTTAAQEQIPQRIPLNEDMKGMLFLITGNITGTLSAQQKLSKLIRDIKITTKKGTIIWKNIRGQDLRGIHLMRNRGKDPGESNVSNSNQTDGLFLPWRIDKSEGDLTMQVTLDSYSVAATGATGGTITCKVVPLYDDAEGNKLVEVLKRVPLGLSAGVNNAAFRLDDGVLVSEMWFTMAAANEADFTDVTFSRDSAIGELDTYTITEATELENATFESGHQTGIFQIPVNEFVVSARTQLDFNMASAEDIDLFVVTPYTAK